MKKNIFGLFLEKLLAFPLWVKQIIYLRLYQDLVANLSEDFITTREENVFHLYVPVLTFAGKTELEEKKGGYESGFYNFLTGVAEGLNMLEISTNNFWTMEEVSKHYVNCTDKSYVKMPESIQVQAMAGFMSGKFRTGEYFKRVGKINIDQLERIIIKQKEYTAKGEHKKIAEIMLELNFVTEKETLSLLKIKEESQKRFILDSDIIPKEVTVPLIDVKAYQDQIAKLTEQNNLLKEKLNKILAFVKKND